MVSEQAAMELAGHLWASTTAIKTLHSTIVETVPEAKEMLYKFEVLMTANADLLQRLNIPYEELGVKITEACDKRAQSQGGDNET